MTAPTLAALLSCLLVLGLTVAILSLGLALVRAAGLTDRRAPHPSPSPSPSPSPMRRRAAPRGLADAWGRAGRLSSAGYRRLREMMDRGLDVYPYWSGGELHGTPVVWDGTRGPHGTGERLTVEEWNAAAEHRTEGAQLDADAGGDDPPSDDLDAHLCPACGRPLVAYIGAVEDTALGAYIGAVEYCPSCAPASFLLQLDALDAERRHDPRRFAGTGGAA